MTDKEKRTTAFRPLDSRHNIFDGAGAKRRPPSLVYGGGFLRFRIKSQAGKLPEDVIADRRMGLRSERVRGWADGLQILERAPSRKFRRRCAFRRSIGYSVLQVDSQPRN